MNTQTKLLDKKIDNTIDNKTEQVIIIGSGPAGLTAAVYAARANLHPLIIDGGTPGGQLMGTTAVENWPGETSILGPTLVINMRKHAEHFGTRFLEQTVIKTDLSTSPFVLETNKGQKLYTHALIIATGATPNRLGCPGEDIYWGKGVTTCAVCDGAFYRDQKVIIVGGGDTAMENASFLRKFTDQVTIVHIRDKFSATHAMQERVLNDPHIKIIYNSTVTEIFGESVNNNPRVTGVTITNQLNNTQETLPAQGVFIAIGLRPNTVPFMGQIATNSHGYITVTNNTNTSIPGVFAAGDVHDYRYKQAITSAGSGCMAAIDAEHYLKSRNLC